jgi:Sigma-70, region 4
MTDLDRLPPDQRAVLSLVLERGRSYGEVAEMLAIPESAVRDRAHTALDALAEDAAVREDSTRQAPTRQTPTRPASGSQSRDSSVAGLAAASTSGAPPRSREPRAPGGASGSRRAGALLLGAIVVVIVVAVILISSGGGKGSSTSTTKSSSTASRTTSAGKPSLNKTISLSSPDPELKAAGTAYVLSESGRSAFYLTAQGLPPSSGFFYAVWLYNSPSSSTPLGRASSVGSDGRMPGGNPLPTNASLYHQLVVTRETSTHPSHPGPIVLRGTFALH